MRPEILQKIKSFVHDGLIVLGMLRIDHLVYKIILMQIEKFVVWQKKYGETNMCHHENMVKVWYMVVNAIWTLYY